MGESIICKTQKESVAAEEAAWELGGYIKPPVPLTAMAVFDAICGHARPNSLIALGSRRPIKSNPGEAPVPHWLTLLEPADRHNQLPGIFEHFVNTSLYYCVQPVDRNKILRGRTVEDYQNRAIEKPNDPYYYPAKNCCILELACIVIDLDVGRPDSAREEQRITAAEAVYLALMRAERGAYPRPSFAAFSGRGAYLAWQLKEPDSLGYPEATTDNVGVWENIGQELLVRTADLASDPLAKRLFNWYKLPDTIDTNTGHRVVYLTIGVDSAANAPRYSLEGLSKSLNLFAAPVYNGHLAPDGRSREAKLQRQREARSKYQAVPGHTKTWGRKEHVAREGKPKRNVKKGKGAEPFIQRCHDLQKLIDNRNGVPEGTRHNTLWLYFQSFSRARYMYLNKSINGKRDAKADRQARDEAYQKIVELNEKWCHPPLNRAELRYACEKRLIRLRSDTAVRYLRVTEKESAQLNLGALVHPAVRAWREKENQKQKERAKGRRLLLRQLINEGKTDRDIVQKLVLNDYEITRQGVNVARSRMRKRGELGTDSQGLF